MHDDNDEVVDAEAVGPLASGEPVRPVEPNKPQKPPCAFCHQHGKGRSYSYWTGTCVKSRRTSDFWTGKIRVRAEYRDLQQHTVRVCRSCAEQWFRRRHLRSVLGVGLPMFGCFAAAAIVPFLNIGADHVMGIAITGCGFGAVLSLLWIPEVWGFFWPSLKVESMEYRVIERIKPMDLDKQREYFTETEYCMLFLGQHDADD